MFFVYGFQLHYDHVLLFCAKQISELKLSLESSSSASKGELDKLRAAAEEERQRLQADMVRAAEEYQQKVAALEAMHEERLRRLAEEKTRELEVWQCETKLYFFFLLILIWVFI